MVTGSERERRIRELEDGLIAKLNRRCGLPLSKRVVQAFHATPRHQFASEFQDLEVVYRDGPLPIWKADDGGARATISQPTFVLQLLELLDVQPGDRVFELGAGSGWNAALLGYLAAPGPVWSYEIIPELAARAERAVRALGRDNVHIVAGDGMALRPNLTFNKGVFTAGATDLPRPLYAAMSEGATLLFVLQAGAGSDVLIVFKKKGAAFESETLIECGFVPVTGPSAEGSDARGEFSRVMSWLGAARASEVHVRACLRDDWDGRIPEGAHALLRKDSVFLVSRRLT